MNKTYKLSALWIMCLIIFNCLSFMACDNEDNEDTNQYTGDINLNVFGPSPVARGGELRFLGNGMDKVTAVVIPGSSEITDIQVISSTEIRVTVPQTAESGLIILKTPKGEITTKTGLTFMEPISLESIAPTVAKAGDELTLTGEYLNLIKEIIFADNVIVKSDAFTKHERKEIKLLIPKEAQTGKIIISDGAEIPNWIYSAEALNITLPSVAQTLDLTSKKPGDMITIQGKDLDLVKQILMPNDERVDFTLEEVAVAALTKSAGSNYKLSFVLPNNASDGAIVMVAYSGVKVAIANIGMAVPASLVATPATDIKAGDVVSIKGVNMELVTSVTFPGITTVVTPSSKTTTEIKVLMPEAAISGNLVLNTASGKTASVAISTLKPEVLAYNPSSVAAGSDVILQGKHLDLVASVTFSGNKKVEVTSSSATELKVKVPVDAEAGEVTLTMKNGETVASASLDVTKPVFCYIPVLPSSEEEIKSGTILSIGIQNGDKLANVQVNGNNAQYILQGSTLNVLIPNNASGDTTLKLISSNGEVSYTISVIGSGITETIVFQGPLSITWSDGGRVIIPISAFDGISVGAILKLYFTQTDNWGQIQINNGGWKAIKFAELGNTQSITTDTYGDKTVTEQGLILTQDVLDNITSNASFGNAVIMQGADFIVNKVSIITKGGGTRGISRKLRK
ncbi:IPT/TIG domain-containing protein [uncultured Bacteroides sp.]|uniref:IPT/TIG domain-containing protein n=1 Tax=uncultured Bacteroides sp. TaxID=162156 RepID=UPI002AAAA695|nr:IPT/TIG domain-containing protein [uncultured Bacteroides sp.]